VRIVSEDGDGMREGDIVEIRYDIMWNGVGVKNGEEICWYSCWDLKRVVELEDVDDRSIDELGLLCGFLWLEIQRISVLVNGCIDDESYIAFTDSVDNELYPEYLEMIAYPIYLRLILARLENGYYRGIGGVVDDVMLMRANAMVFNLPKSLLYKFARKTVKELANQFSGLFVCVLIGFRCFYDTSTACTSV
jgi:hypothetical protein